MIQGAIADRNAGARAGRPARSRGLTETFVGGDARIADAVPAQTDAVPIVRAPRTKVLLSATIAAGALQSTVRIRDMSSSGALLEGNVLPAAGTMVTLKRGDLQVGGVVIWSKGTRCGISFEGGTVTVGDWIAGKAGTALTRNQAQVDALQADIRSGAPIPATVAVQAGSVAAIENIEHRLAEEVSFALRLIEGIAEELADEPIVVQRHGRTLQDFDLAGQILGHVAKILAADDRRAAVDALGMEDMRARLLRRAVVRN